MSETLKWEIMKKRLSQKLSIKSHRNENLIGEIRVKKRQANTKSLQGCQWGSYAFDNNPTNQTVGGNLVHVVLFWPEWSQKVVHSHKILSAIIHTTE